ncbi:MAG TPA: flagellar basal-body MS-ring/collar protein FliF [Terriglobales bacterium]|nr:flagellar basal-body MS-ring/collar protein FliF [Terriglobales bacterium]
MDQGLKQIQEFLRGLSLRQKLLLTGGAAVVALTLWGFVVLFGQGKNVTLYSGLRPADAQSIAGRLAAKNIPYEISPDGGSVLVPQEKVDAARLETAAQGLPRNARLGFELFDTPNWAGSDFSEKVNYQRALEGELERTLQTLNEVEAVRVHLVLPRESLFTEQEHESKAAVIVKTRGGTLSKEAQQAIPELVASAVDGLRPENVTVVDADTATPFLARRGPGGRASFDSDEELAAAAVHAIEPVVGADHVRASVHVDYDLSTSENTSETFDPKSTAPISQQHSEELAGGANPAGVPGTASNIPGAAAPSPTITATLDNQSSKSDTATYAVSKNIRRVSEPAGRVRRITAAVLIDDATETAPGKDGKLNVNRRKRTAEEMTAIEKLARAAIGVDDQRGDLLALENLSFQAAPIETPSAPGKFERYRLLLVPWTGVLRYLGITFVFLLVYALVLRPVKKQALTAFRQIPQQLAQASAAAVAPAAGIELPSGSEESKRALALKKELTDKIKSEPAAASRLVQTWIREQPNSK